MSNLPILGALIDQEDLEKLLGHTIDNDQDVVEEVVNREGGDGPMIRFEREEERTFKRAR